MATTSANGNQTVTTAAAHIDEVWVDGVIRALEFALEIAPRVDRSWDFAGHGDVYHKARIPNIETQSKAASTALDAVVYTDTEQTITINKHVACAIKHEDIAGLLSRNDVKSEMQKKMGYALGRKVDVDLASLAQNFSQIQGTLGVELTYDQLLTAVQYLEEAGYRMNDNVTWIFSPAQRAGLMKMDTFVNAQYVGEANAVKAHQNGTTSSFQGAPIVFSNLTRSPAAGQHENFVFHQETIALIMAQEPKTSTDRIALDLADIVVQDQVYGYSEITRYDESAFGSTGVSPTDSDTGAVLLRGT